MIPSIDIAIEADRRLVQELGRHRQVDACAVQVGMAEIGRERRQQPLHISALAVPRRQPVNGRGVAERVQARCAPTVILAIDSSGLEQLLECIVDIVLPHLCSVPVCQEGRLHPFRQWAVRTSFGIGPKRDGELASNGNEAALVELGVAHRQHGVRKVDIPHGQVERLAGSQTSPIQDQEECPEGIGIEAAGTSSADIDGFEQALQFLTGEDVRRR